MSADNFHVVRQDPDDGTWVVSMGFASTELEPCKTPLDPRDRRYRSESEALDEAVREWSEYGASTEMWCIGQAGHLQGCVHGNAGEHHAGSNGQPRRPDRVEKESHL